MLARLLIITVVLTVALDLSARGRARGYQAGGGVHRVQIKRSKEAKSKQPKKALPAAAPKPTR